MDNNVIHVFSLSTKETYFESLTRKNNIHYLFIIYKFYVFKGLYNELHGFVKVEDTVGDGQQNMIFIFV